jgi:dipeptidyl aminopeptidase/acylaminoacyl peptidase
MRAYLKSISPITRVAEVKTPIYIVHPGKDIRVIVDQGREMAKALKANNATVWYAEFTDAGHDNFPGSNANNDWFIASWAMFMKTFVLN